MPGKFIARDLAVAISVEQLEDIRRLLGNGRGGQERPGRGNQERMTGDSHSRHSRSRGRGRASSHTLELKTHHLYYTRPHFFRKNHSNTKRHTKHKKNFQLSHKVSLLWVSTSNCLVPALICSSRPGSCSGATVLPEVIAARLSKAPTSAAGLLSSRSCSKTRNRARAVPIG